MKIAFVISSLQMGGAERVASVLCSYWAEELFWDVSILTLTGHDCVPAYEISPKIRLVPMGVAGVSKTPIHALVNLAVRARAVRHHIASISPDAVIAFGDTTNCLVLTAIRDGKWPVIISERVDPRLHPIGHAWEIARRYLYNKCDTLVVQTQTVYSYFPANLRNKCRIIGNPIPIPERPFGSSSRQPRFIAAGRLVEQKGFDLLVQSFARIADDLPEWRLVVFGEGPDRLKLEQLVKDLGLTRRIVFAGTRKNLHEEFSTSEIFVLSSRYEGFPNALCEAMLSGTAVISFDCLSGPSEIITHRADGLLVENGNVLALAQAMLDLARKPALRIQLASAAEEKIRSRYSVAAISRQWECLLEDLSKKAPVPA